MSNISLKNVHCAADPMFIPGNDPKGHRCLITVIENLGKNSKTQEEMTNRYQLVFYSKYAQTAAIYLRKGRCITVDGEAHTWAEQTGQVLPSGKPDIRERFQIRVRKFYFGPENKKDLLNMLTANIERARGAGMIPQNCTLNAEFLMERPKIPFYDYNPQLANQTGKYGNASVWVKGVGFLGNGKVAPAPDAAAPVAAAGGVDEVALLKAQIAQLKAEKDAAGGAAAIAGSDTKPF
jgi:hypothetical protein